jgi:integrase
MAWLETKGHVFRIRFRFGGSKCLHSLHTSAEREARDALARFEEHQRWIDRGIIAPPPEGADIGVYIMSGGKHTERPSETPLPPRPTLTMLFDGYLEGYPTSAKEANTWRVEKIHIAHLKRLLDAETPLAEFSAQHAQAYIQARSREIGRFRKPVRSETIQKEIGTLAAVWNRWGIPQGMIDRPAPTARLIYPKEKAKLPFQTWGQIERQLKRRPLTAGEEAELWHSLFLTLDEVEQVLDHVQARSGPLYVYPMFVFAAHTGARRSEMRRALVTDFDFESKTVMIREKKKDHAKEETYRFVPMSARLQEAMRACLAANPSGTHAIWTKIGGPLTDHRATQVFNEALAGSKWSVIPGWHCFRHSFISNCVAKGIDQRLIDHWVGHTTEEMRKRYSHLLPNVSQAALLTVFN